MYTVRSIRFHENDEGKEMAFCRFMPDDGARLDDVVAPIAFGDVVEELRTIPRGAAVDVELFEGKKGLILTDIMAI